MTAGSRPDGLPLPEGVPTARVPLDGPGELPWVAGTGSAGWAALTPAGRRRSGSRWAAAGIAAAVVLTGAAIWHFGPGRHVVGVVLPRTLLGLNRYDGPGAQGLEGKLERKVVAASQGTLTRPVAGIYGSPPGPWFTVAGGGPCAFGSCAAGTARQAARYGRAHGMAGARAFPPGRLGGGVVCSARSVRRAGVFDCFWADQATSGVVSFFGGSVSGLARAAAETGQIRAAIER